MGKYSSTLKVSELIGILEHMKEVYGDKSVYLSSDEEGNSYSTIAQDSFSVELDKSYMVIYPYEEYVELPLDK